MWYLFNTDKLIKVDHGMNRVLKHHISKCHCRYCEYTQNIKETKTFTQWTNEIFQQRNRNYKKQFLRVKSTYDVWWKNSECLKLKNLKDTLLSILPHFKHIYPHIFATFWSGSGSPLSWEHSTVSEACLFIGWHRRPNSPFFLTHYKDTKGRKCPNFLISDGNNGIIVLEMWGGLRGHGWLIAMELLL